jgi:hypothetical protein
VDVPLRPRCPVCKSEHRAQIEALLATKMPMADIHAETQRLGRGIKRETIGKHLAICLNGIRPPVDANGVVEASKAAQSQAEVDFATMVQKRATELLQSGDLRVTAQHGLTAQALIDRRAEKAADRDLALNMARLLSGSMTMAPITVIDSRAVEVLELDAGLAPMDIVDA